MTINKINSALKYSFSSLQLRPVAKFESVGDIALKTFTKLFIQSELDIMKNVAEKSTNEPKLSRLQGFLKNLNKIFEKITKLVINEESKDPPLISKSEHITTLKENKSKQTQNQGKITNKFRTITDLPVEVHDQVINLWDVNDFCALADVAECDRCLNIAIYARAWLTTRLVK